jgi:Flp pilus assembly pilin Flp
MNAMVVDGMAVSGMAALRELQRLLDDASGATAVEYALIASAIAGLITVVVYVLGAKTHNLYNNAANGW